MREPEYEAGALRQVAIEVPRDWNLRKEVDLRAIAHVQQEPRRISEKCRAGGRNGTVGNVRIEHNRFIWKCGVVRRLGSSQRPAERIVHHVPIIQLIREHEPGDRDDIEPGIDIILIAELVPEIVSERMPIAGGGELIEPMRDEFISLIDRSLEADLSSSKLGRGFHRFPVSGSAG